MKDRKNVFTFYLPLIVMFVFVVFPYVWTFLTSIKHPFDVYERPLVYISKDVRFENYPELLAGRHFVDNIRNSLIVSSITTCFSLVVATMSGYAFSRYDFRGKHVVLGSFILIYMIPQVLLLVPLFKIMLTLGVLNTYFSLIIAYMTFSLPLAVWLMTAFIGQIPIELDEAAMVDGCTRLRAFIHIDLPLLRPGLLAVASFIFIAAWNEYIYAVTFTGKQTATITVGLAHLMGEHLVEWNLMTAGGVIAVIPVIVIFTLVQKNLVSGLSFGAIKG